MRIWRYGSSRIKRISFGRIDLTVKLVFDFKIWERSLTIDVSRSCEFFNSSKKLEWVTYFTENVYSCIETDDELGCFLNRVVN